MVLRNELIADVHQSGDDGESRSWSSEVECVSMPQRHQKKSLSPILVSHIRGGQLSAEGGETKVSSSSLQSRDSIGRLSVEGFSLNL